MRIFKYIFKSSFINTIISTLVIIGLVWVSQSFRSIKFILDKGGTIIDFFKLSIFSMPSWLTISISFGVFFGILITFSKLENEKEIIAMRTSGLDSLQIALPAIIMGIVFSMILFLNLHILLPHSYTFYKNYENNLRHKSPKVMFNEGKFYHIDNKTFFAKSLSGTQAKNLFIQDNSVKNQTTEIISKMGTFVVHNNEVKIKLLNGVKLISKNNSEPIIINFIEDTIIFKKTIKEKQNKIKVGRVIDLKELTFFELINQINKDNKINKIMLAEAHSRNIFSFTPLLFTLILLSIFLKNKFSKFDSFLKKFFIFCIIFSIQIILFVLKNLVSKYTGFIYYFYGIPAFLIIICIFLIKFENISKFKINKNYV